MSIIPTANRQSQFLIDGLVSSRMTILAGEPKAGKSLLTVAMAAALLEGDGDFLGRPVRTRLGKVAFGLTDPDGLSETRGRLEGLITDLDRVIGTDVRDDGTGTYWGRVADALKENRADLFILDNVLGALPGDANIADPLTARRFLDGIDKIMHAGIPVLVVTHTAKPSMEGGYGGGTSSPIGGRLFGARPRAVLSLMRSKKEGVRLQADTNHAERVELPLTVVVRDDGAPVWTVTEKAPERATERATPRPDWRRELADRIVADNPACGSLREVAATYAAGVEKSPETVRQRLGGYVTHQGGRWVRTGGTPLTVVGG